MPDTYIRQAEPALRVIEPSDIFLVAVVFLCRPVLATAEHPFEGLIPGTCNIWVDVAFEGIGRGIKRVPKRRGFAADELDGHDGFG